MQRLAHRLDLPWLGDDANEPEALVLRHYRIFGVAAGDDGVAGRQAEARAGALGREVGDEDFLQVLLWDANALVADRYLHVGAGLGRWSVFRPDDGISGLNGDRPAIRHRLLGVDNQVVD